MKAFLCRAIPITLLFLSAHALGSEAARGLEEELVSIRPPHLLQDLELLAPSETLALEKICVLDEAAVWGNPRFSRDSSLELGLRIALPQKLPARSQYFVRYTCPRPGVRQ